jgi:hypothetical protein
MANVNPRGLLLGVPGLLFAGLLWLAFRLDLPRDGQMAVVVVGLVVTIVAIVVIARWASKADR